MTTLYSSIFFFFFFITFTFAIYVYLCIIYRKRKYIHKQFRRLALLILVSTLFDIVCGLTLIYCRQVPGIVNQVLHSIHYCATVVMAQQFFVYVVAYIYQFKRRRRIILGSNILLAASSIFYCLNIPFGFICSFSAVDGSMIHARLYNFIYILPFIYIALAFVFFILNHASYKIRQWIALDITIFLILVAVVVQTLTLPELRLSFYAISLGFFTLYLTIETPDYFTLMKTIRELIAAKETVKKALDEAQAAHRAKNEFLANMSHEFRTPVHAILGYNELIMRDTERPEIFSYAVNIQTAGRMLLNIFNNIIDFINIRSNQLTIRNTPYYVLSLFEDAAAYARHEAEKKKITFSVSIDPELPERLSGDFIRLTQIIDNLLSNAFKFTQTGQITLTARWQDQTTTKGCLSVSVQDTGIGLKADDIDKVKDSFSRFDLKKNRNIQGIGMGLPVVTKLLSLMGSELQINSTYGTGSTFSFTVEQEIIDPMRIGKQTSLQGFSAGTAQSPDSTEDSVLCAPDARMLVIDDNQMNLDVLRGILRPTKIQVETALSGPEGLQMLERNTYHIVFLDHMMPFMDGIETMQEIKERGLCRDIPVIAFTANTVGNSLNSYREAGFTDFLCKPVSSSKMYAILERHLDKSLITGHIGVDYPVEQASAGASKGAPAAVKRAAPVPFNKRFAFLDIKTGLSYCMDNETFYLEMLDAYLKSNHADDIQKFYDEEDLNNYRIAVHAVKSTSLTIGGVSVSEQAKALEAAAKAGDTAYIQANHEQFIQDYKTLVKNITEALQAPAAQKQELLLVTASPVLVQSAEQLLSEQYTLITADSGMQAMKSIKETVPSLILLDSYLPDCSSTDWLQQFAEYVRQSQRQRLVQQPVPQTPVLLLAFSDDQDLIIRGLHAGAADYITLPLVQDIALHRIAQVTANSGI